MKTFMSYRNAVKGLAALALVFSVSCGKKGGGGSTATPPGTTSTNGDCSSSTSKCKLGQKYTSGVFLGSGTGEAQYGYDKYISLYLGFFAKDSKAIQKQDNYVSYNGDVTANGTLKITKGSYGFLTNPNPNRMVSAVTFDFNWDFGFGNGYDTGYDNGNYYYPDYSSCSNSYNCGTCQTSNCGNNDQSSVCELPVGTYKVATTTVGQWNEYYYMSPDITNLKVKITGSSRTVVGSFSGYLDFSSSTSGTLHGSLNFQTVNGKTCNLPVVF